MEVHKELGAGFLEPVYQEALCRELSHQNVPFEKEKELSIIYKVKPLLRKYFADFICYDIIILEIKTLCKLTPEHEAQILNYLKATKLKLGLLVNFGETSLKYKRMVL